ncbi:glycosyltransferase family 4 protein [Bradyrhizobium sp. CCBAU 21360]|uniref:glycosyltransferase family 4 protein n=1 Tax=Bradyrhizobium sp. CCBAU 21360 TaxID=1325081 RepID=UPI0023061E86|nr:glycosyltransferase family 4 protein [Bradyrhizobium sp. CCBAU 21360]
MTLRTLHLIHTPRHSGAEILVDDLCTRHSQKGHIVGIASLEPTDPLFRETLSRLEATGTSLHIPSRRHNRLQRVAHLRGAITAFDPDVVFAHSVLPSLYGRLALPLLQKRPKFVTVLHSATNDDFSGSYFRLIERTLRWRADYVVAVSEAGGRSYKARFGSALPVCTIKNGIDLQRFRSIDRAAVRKSYAISDPTKILLQVGRVSPVKQQLSSIELLSSLVAAGWDVELWLAGLTEDASYEAKLRSVVAEARLAHRVRFLGSRSDVPELLGAADLYLMPSYAEAHSIAFLEALASNVPILASNIEAFRFASGMPAVRLVENGDPSLRKEAESLLSNNARTPRRLEQFDISCTARSYLQLATQICGGDVLVPKT